MVATIVAVVCALNAPAAAQTSSTVAGTVKDTQGGSIRTTVPTIRNNQYNPDDSLNTARLTPANAGAGAATGAQAMRTIQMQLRFMF
jgi:hypothetical protein